MGLADRALNPFQGKNAVKPPPGHEPGALEWDGEKGTLHTPLMPETTVWDDTLREHTPFSPETHMIVPPVKYKTWTMPGSEDPHYWYALTIVERTSSARLADVEELSLAIGKRKARPRSDLLSSGTHLHVCLADWQAGKAERGGIAELGNRVEALGAQVESRWKELKRLKLEPSVLHVNGLGDLVENCRGFYSGQHFQIDSNLRTQRRFVRRALLELLDRWGRFAPEVHVHAVGGNHGENRATEGSDTDAADNFDVAVFEDCADAMALNPERYHNYKWQLPEHDLTLTYAHDNFVIGMAHGHQAQGKDLIKWWAGQMKGRRPVGDADLLVTGHYHHTVVNQEGPRTWIQCPTLDGGSPYFAEKTGLESPPGTMTFVTDGAGWFGMEVMPAPEQQLS